MGGKVGGQVAANFGTCLHGWGGLAKGGCATTFGGTSIFLSIIPCKFNRYGKMRFRHVVGGTSRWRKPPATHFASSEASNPLDRHVNFVITPGLLDGRK